MAISIGGIEATGTVVQRQANALSPEALPIANIADQMMGVAGDATFRSAQATLFSSTPPHPVSPSPQVLGSVQMLVVLSAITPLEERRRMLVMQARRGLDGLDRLHGELLSGNVSRSTLEALAQWAREGQGEEMLQNSTDDDPKFKALLQDIDMRVRIELAKFDIEV